MGAFHYINTPTVTNDIKSNVSTIRVLTSEIDRDLSTASNTSSPSDKFTSHPECWIPITYAVVLVICLIIICTFWRFRHHLFKQNSSRRQIGSNVCWPRNKDRNVDTVDVEKLSPTEENH